MSNRAMGSHQSAAMITDTWLTPPELIKALGDFDLDPCTPIEMPWDTAKHRYTPNDDGLTLPWHGRVWLNPPYGKEAGKMERNLILEINSKGHPAYIYFGGKHLNVKWTPPNINKIRFIVKPKTS